MINNWSPRTTAAGQRLVIHSSANQREHQIFVEASLRRAAASFDEPAESDAGPGGAVRGPKTLRAKAGEA